MITLFWTLLALTLYGYIFYPFLIYVWAQLSHRPVKKGNYEPSVSIVISVYNEEKVIGKKIENILSLDYPAQKVEILIGSDGSTDQTVSTIKSFNDKRIFVLESTFRRGKMAVINELIKRSQNDVIVFMDARQIWEKNAIKELVSNFTDQTVGSVSGELILSNKEEGTAKGLNLYWTYEKFIRDQESHVHSMLGATGAIYAIRRHLFKEIPVNVVLDDMYTPFEIIKQGYRAIYDDRAKAYDEVATNPHEEHRRKVRTLYGNFQIFSLMPEMFNPFASPIAIQLFSHKFLRVIIPFFLIILLVINWQLRFEPFYNVLFWLQIVFYAMAAIGCLARNIKYGILKTISRLCYVPYVFCLLNICAFQGFLRFIASKQQVTWKKANEI